VRDDEPGRASEIAVTRNRDLGRWEARVSGRLAGVLVYRLDDDGRTVLEHTEVDEAFEGRGIGSRLARTALEELRAAGDHAIVECPFVSAWVRRHRDFDDIIEHR
jgi:hypothetical protein